MALGGRWYFLVGPPPADGATLDLPEYELRLSVRRTASAPGRAPLRSREPRPGIQVLFQARLRLVRSASGVRKSRREHGYGGIHPTVSRRLVPWSNSAGRPATNGPKLEMAVELSPLLRRPARRTL